MGPGEPLSAPSSSADLSLKTFPSSHLWPIRLSDWKHSHSCWKNHFCRPYSFKSRLMTKIWYGSIFSFFCWTYYFFITLRGTMGVEKKIQSAFISRPLPLWKTLGQVKSDKTNLKGEIIKIWKKKSFIIIFSVLYGTRQLHAF